MKPDVLPRFTRESTRIHFIDNLRSTIIALVILHHSALPFAGIPVWPWQPANPVSKTTLSASILEMFVAINMAWFMGWLFLFAAHFSALAVEKKTWQAFVRDRLKRLGVPILAWALIGEPMVMVLVRMDRGRPVWPRVQRYLQRLHLDALRNHVWFVALLLVFDIVHVTVKKLLPSAMAKIPVPSSAQQYRAAAFFGITGVIVCSFFVRCWFPVGYLLPVLSMQPAYATQYIFAYTVGTSLAKIQPYLLVANPARRLGVVLLCAALSIPVLYHAAAQFGVEVPHSPWVSGMSVFAAFHAIWTELCFYFVGTALFALFHNWPRTQRQWGMTARFSYAAYLLHSLVVIVLQIFVERGTSLELPGLVNAVLYHPYDPDDPIPSLCVFGALLSPEIVPHLEELRLEGRLHEKDYRILAKVLYQRFRPPSSGLATVLIQQRHEMHPNGPSTWPDDLTSAELSRLGAQGLNLRKT
ncbi:Acyltransferase 3 [Mycena kentingensis (nom. inval.)]|nr:Acyltransferase 3 [Mycena kentingensis (nom. inval.)]